MAQPLYILPPFDPSAYPSISGPQLLQYLSGAKNTDESGFIIWTEDTGVTPSVPDADTYPELQRFIWVRQLATSVAAYVWDETAASNVTYLKWISLNVSGIAPGSIIGSMIADNTIPDSKIISLDWSKITGAPENLPPSGAAGGDLAGTYPDPQIANEAVTTGKLDDEAVTTAKIADEAVTFGKIDPSTIGNQILQTNAGATAVGWVTKDIVTLANPASAADVGKVPTVANPYTDGYTLKSPANFIPSYFHSDALPAAGATLTLNHGLAGVPQFVSIRMKCTTNDAGTGWLVGDYCDAIAALNSSGTFEGVAFQVVITTTQIRIVANGSGTTQLLNKATGNTANITSRANFTLETSAIYLP